MPETSDELRSRTWLGDGGKNGVDEFELADRRERWQPPPIAAERGWTRLYVDHVTQADTGVDLDFLIGGSGDAPSRAPF
jgi:dihydroxyacid dehydratase/phosphogluconate dehydratase